MNVEIVIPTYADEQTGVAECVENVRRTTGLTPIVECRPDLNVAEARLAAPRLPVRDDDPSVHVTVR